MQRAVQFDLDARVAMPQLPIAASYAIVFATLAVFGVVAVAGLKMSKLSVTDKDSYFTARNSQSTFSLAMTFFASGMGAWVLFAVAEVGTYTGSLGVAGYALSAIAPLIILDRVSPFLRRELPNGVTLHDFVALRFGKSMTALLAVISAFYMFIYLVAELTSVGGAVALITGIDPLAPVLGTSLITLAYSSVGGLPVSLLTDQVQGVMVIVLVVLLCIAVFAYNPLPKDAIIDSGAADVTLGGLRTAVTLILAVTAANLFHSGYWQRVWAATDNRAMTRGVLIANGLQLVVMVLFGVIGMMAVAVYGSALFSPEYVAFLAAFFFIAELPVGWQVIAVIATVCMVASSADTLQNGLAALFAASPRVSVRSAMALTVLLNVPAIILATLQLSVLSLFILADLLAAAVCVPIGLGLWYRTHPTAALAGSAVGLLSILVVFAVSGALSGSVAVGLSGIYYAFDLSSPTLLVAFILAPALSGLVTVGGSLLVPGYRFAGFPKVDVAVTKA
uniref:Sodium:solute symporter n=1 Tax=Diacronema lutheri TaxID=2081491 RepID=A0A7R9YLB6_DIALT